MKGKWVIFSTPPQSPIYSLFNSSLKNHFEQQTLKNHSRLLMIWPTFDQKQEVIAFRIFK
jgi:hypothetical protein